MSSKSEETIYFLLYFGERIIWIKGLNPCSKHGKQTRDLHVEEVQIGTEGIGAIVEVWDRTIWLL